MPTPYPRITDEELIERLEAKKSFTEIGREFGVTKQAVEFLARRRFGEKYSKKNQRKKETEEAMYYYRQNGHILTEAAKELNLHPASLARRFKKEGFDYGRIHKRWTPEEIEQIKQMRAEGRKHREIAEYFDTTPSAIMSALYVRREDKKQNKFRGLPKKNIIETGKKVRKEAGKLLKEGFTAEEISKKIGISIPRVYQIAKEVGGDAEGIRKRSSLSEMNNMKEQIRKMREKGISCGDIAEKLGVNRVKVYNIIKKIKGDQEG